MIYQIHFKSGKVLEISTDEQIDFTETSPNSTLNRRDFWVNNNNVEYIIEKAEFKKEKQEKVK